MLLSPSERSSGSEQLHSHHVGGFRDPSPLAQAIATQALQTIREFPHASAARLPQPHTSTYNTLFPVSSDNPLGILHFLEVDAMRAADRMEKDGVYRKLEDHAPLVGIEPNPGPPRGGAFRPGGQLLSLLTEGAAELGSALARSQKSKKGAGKPKAKGAGKSRKPKSKGYELSGARVTSNPVPVSSGMVITRSVRAPSIKVPFNVSHIGVFSTNNGSLVFGGIGSTKNWLDLDPSSTINSVPVFGAPLANLAQSFTRYRLLRLRCFYRACTSTAATGSLALATVDDGAIGAVNIDFVTNCDGCTTGAVWQNMEVPCHFEREWKFIDEPSTVDTASYRQTIPGVLLVSTPVAVNVTTHFGWMQFVGEFEFDDLTATPTLQLARRPDRVKPARSLPNPGFLAPALVPTVTVSGPVETIPMPVEEEHYVCPEPRSRPMFR